MPVDDRHGVRGQGRRRDAGAGGLVDRLAQHPGLIQEFRPDGGGRLIEQPGGNPTLEPGAVDRAARAARAAGARAAGVTTVADIEPNLRRRLALIGRWTQPVYSSVNLCEEGAVEVMRTLLAAGIGIEAGVWTPQDAQALVTCGLADQVTRVLVEPGEAQSGKSHAVPMVDAIHEILDRADIKAPRLQHGDGELTWILIEDAVRRGLDTRVGLEDTLYLPDGSRARDNVDLVTAARNLGAGAAGSR